MDDPSDPVKRRDDSAGARYDRDLYSWAVEQAALPVLLERHHGAPDRLAAEVKLLWLISER